MNLLAELSKRPSLLGSEELGEFRGRRDLASPDEPQKEVEAEELIGSLGGLLFVTGICQAPLLVELLTATLKRAEQIGIRAAIPV